MIIHNYNNLAGTTQLWDTSDSFENYQKNLENPVRQALLKKHGHIDSVIEYRFNSEGFRGPEIDNPECACFGCSFTMGTGVDEQETWANQLAQMLDCTTANLGHAGSSNDTALRMALHYLPILRPKYALWLQTDQNRVEIFHTDDRVVNIMAGHVPEFYIQDNFVKSWFLVDQNQQLNLEKNTLAFRHLCRELNIDCVVIKRDQVPAIDLARDLMHPGKLSYKKLAKMFAERM